MNELDEFFDRVPTKVDGHVLIVGPSFGGVVAGYIDPERNMATTESRHDDLFVGPVKDETPAKTATEKLEAKLKRYQEEADGS